MIIHVHQIDDYLGYHALRIHHQLNYVLKESQEKSKIFQSYGE